MRCHWSTDRLTPRWGSNPRGVFSRLVVFFLVAKGVALLSSIHRCWSIPYILDQEWYMSPRANADCEFDRPANLTLAHPKEKSSANYFKTFTSPSQEGGITPFPSISLKGLSHGKLQEPLWKIKGLFHWRIQGMLVESQGMVYSYLQLALFVMRCV